MNKQYWLSKWQSNQIGFNQPKPHPLLIEYFQTLNLPKQSRIFVPLCGISIDMLWLIEQQYQVVGIEISKVACETFFQDYNLDFTVKQQGEFLIYTGANIELICGDFFKLDKHTLKEVNAIYDRAALIALPPETREKYAHQLLRITPATSKIFLISITYNPKEMNGPPFSVFADEIAKLYKDTLHQINCKQITNISPHLKDKGLTNACEELYISK